MILKNDLQILIEAWQSESDRLETELHACVKDWDFKRAERFRVALAYTKKRLNILQNLDDPNYDHLTSLKDHNKGLLPIFQELKEKDDSRSRIHREILKEMAIANERELVSLGGTFPPPNIESDELITCLHDLLSKDTNSVEIQLNDGDRKKIYLTRLDFIPKVAVQIKVLLPSADKISRKEDANLKRMGFQVVGDAATMTIEPLQKSSILTILEILAKIRYEVFGLYGGKQATIISNLRVSHQEPKLESSSIFFVKTRCKSKPLPVT